MRIIRKLIGLVCAGFFGIGFGALAFITLLPATASKPNMLGYYGVCSFAPGSTTILLILSAAFILLGLKLVKNRTQSQRGTIPLTSFVK